ncbi:MAG: hypothetical protein AB7E73_12795 [Burkholderiales bacterium]
MLPLLAASSSGYFIGDDLVINGTFYATVDAGNGGAVTGGSYNLLTALFGKAPD